MSTASNHRTLTARWIFPADAPPLERGTITIQDDKIVAVEPAGTRTPDDDLGNVAILPGLVNAHTHLDLSDARGKIPPTPDFTAWLRGVIAHRRVQTPADVGHAIAAGIVESQRFGATLVADIAANGISWDALVNARLRAVVHYELIGLSKERFPSLVQEAFNWDIRHAPTPTCRAGLSPHAPYSVSEMAFAWFGQRGGYVSIHLAESPAELELLEHHTGPFVPFLADLNAWEPSALVGSPQDLINIVGDTCWAFFVHCNYLSPVTIIPPHAAIVYCPRTHAAFGHPPHPFREFMKRGVRVVLGTDSLASNPDLDILAEARFVAARHPDLPGETLLRMITLDSAIALGWGDVAGSLTPGKSADLVVLPVPDRDEGDPYRLVFDSAIPVKQVMFRGLWRP